MAKQLPLIDCQHADASPARPITCAAGHFKGHPSPGSCRVCPHRVSRGLPELLTWHDAPDPVVEQPNPARAVAVDRWPKWATWVASLKADGDVGVGSTIERMLGAGGRIFKATFAAFGVDCGCADRRKRWDELYPYA